MRLIRAILFKPLGIAKEYEMSKVGMVTEGARGEHPFPPQLSHESDCVALVNYMEQVTKRGSCILKMTTRPKAANNDGEHQNQKHHKIQS